MKSRIWIILAILLICNVLGYAVLMADSEARAAALSAWETVTDSVTDKVGAAPQLKASAVAAPVAPAAAAFATITVNTRVDEGQLGFIERGRCSLREAIQSAQTDTAVGGCVAGSPGVDTIQISLPPAASDQDSGGNIEIDIEAVLPTITTDINFIGGNPGANVFQRSHAGVPEFRVLDVAASATVSLQGITVCNGVGNMNGVAIRNAGTLTLNTVRVTANNPTDDITNPIGNGTIQNNGTLTMENCEVTLNYAGNGAGLFNAGVANISRSIFGSNISTITNPTVTGGGGIYNQGTLMIEKSAIINNTARRGGGLYNTLGTATLTNCSLGGNLGDINGAALNVESGVVNFSSVTLGPNGTPNGAPLHDASIYLDEGELYYRNTIFGAMKVDGAFTLFNLFNSNGFMNSEGHNISNDTTIDLDSGLGDFPAETDPLLDSLSTYGTSTENPFQIDTFRLRCGSPAIDAAYPTDDPTYPSPTTDARGVARYDSPDDLPNGSNFPDIGAHEFDYRIVTDAALPNYVVGTPYNQTLVGAGGETPYFWDITGGTLHPDLSFDNATGAISGTPIVGGTYTFEVTLKPDTFGVYDECPVKKTFTLQANVSCGSFTFNPASLPSGALGTAYNQTVSVTGGGTPPNTFTIDSGALPTGLSLAANGAITGTPTFPGVYNFVVKVTSTAPAACFSTKSYSITVGCGTNQVTVSPTSLTAGTVGTNYNPTNAQTFTSNRTPVSWTVTAGTLPTGLSLSADGKLTGTPTTSVGSPFSFTVSATYGNEPNTCLGSRAYSMTINCATVSLSSASFPNATCDTSYTTSPTITASGGAGPYTIALNPGSTLPAGLSLTQDSTTTAKVTSTPTVVVTNHPFTVKATDANGCSFTRNYSITVGCPTITVGIPGVATATVGTNFSRSFTSSKTGATFTLASGTLPSGVTLSSGGLLSGTPTQSGNFPITVTATVGACSATSAIYTLVVSCPTIVLSPSTLPNGTQGTAYPNQQFSAMPNTLTYSYKVLSGTLPTGLNLTSGGLLSGTPTASGTFIFTICATSAGVTGTCTGQQSFTVTIASNNTAPTFGTTQNVSRQKGSPAGTAVTIALVSDAQTAAGSLTVTQISDPAATATGITVTNIVNNNGTITAQVAASCTATAGTVCLQVSDGTLTTKGTFNVTLTNNTAPTLTYGTVNPVKQGTVATVNPATGPSDNGTISSIVVQSVTPSVPTGAITVNNSTGVVTINNTVAIGQYAVTVRATDNCGTTTDATLTVNVVGSLLITEFALSGPNGQNDWFVELYNNTTAVQYTTGLNVGFVNNIGTYVTINLPNNGMIQPRSNYLLKGSASSLDAAIPFDQTVVALPVGFNPCGVAVARGSVDSAANLIDSVGMTNFASIYVENTAVAWLNNTTRVHAFVRKTNSAGLPTDTNNNQADFNLVAPDTTPINSVTPLPGAPGPQSATAPILNNAGMPVVLLKPTVSATTFPNAEVKTETYVGGTITFTRSLYLRRTITNNSGAPVKKLRFRIAELSSGGTNIANLRALTSSAVVLTVDGQPVSVKGLTLEEPPAQANGGGVNSTVCEGTITMAAPLAAGAKVNVQFRLGIISGGSYRFYANIETQN